VVGLGVGGGTLFETTGRCLKNCSRTLQEGKKAVVPRGGIKEGGLGGGWDTEREVYDSAMEEGGEKEFNKRVDNPVGTRQTREGETAEESIDWHKGQ